MEYLTAVIVVRKAARTNFTLANKIAREIQLHGIDLAYTVRADEVHWPESSRFIGVVVIFGAAPGDIETAKMWCGSDNVFIYKGDLDEALHWAVAADTTKAAIDDD
jgi:hypothetical protein